MSTKTSIKRIAAVAAVALGLGGLASIVAPAANASSTLTYTVGTPSATPAVTGLASTITVPVNITGVGTNAPSDTATVSIAVSTKPATSSAANSAIFTAQSTSTVTPVSTDTRYGVSATTAQATVSSAYVRDVTTVTNGTAAISAAAAIKPLVVSDKFAFNPDKAGTWVLAIWDDANGNGALDAGDGVVQYLTVVVQDAPATGVTLTNALTGSAYATYDATNTPDGAWVKVQAVDSTGAATALSSTQQVLLTIPTGAYLYKKQPKGGSTTAVGPITAGQYGLVQGDFDNTGAAYVSIYSSTAGSYTITGSVVGGTSTGSVTLTYKAVTGYAVSNGGFTNLAGTSIVASTGPILNEGSVNITSASAATTGSANTSLALGVQGSTAVVMPIKISGTSGSVFAGNNGLVSEIVADASAATAATAASTVDGTLANDFLGTVSLPITLAAQADGSYASVTVYAASSANTWGTGLVISGSGTTATKLTLAAPLQSTITVAVGSSVTTTFKCVDQYGAAKANVTLTPAVAGRNFGLLTLPTLVTDASGKATFTYTDASTSTTSLVDTISASGCTTSGTLLTVNFGTTTVSSLKVTGGNYSASVFVPATTPTPISAGDGVEAGAVGIIATVKDANGVIMVGVPVTFSVAGTGVAFKSTSATVYSGTAGTATGYIYGWIAGTYTYTVSAGGQTFTGTITFADSTPANARTISAAIAGNVVTATVKDRFGNPVSGSRVYIKTTGGANVGGMFQTYGTTLADGTVSFVVTGSGTAAVYSNLDPSALAGTIPSDQSCALAGNYTCAQGATAAVAFTASTAGTATTAESGVGASIAPAGVNSASVTVAADTSSVDAAQAAQDAANEATDAANAATDAANNAMDSADAATAAAQDAGDKADAALAAITDLATKVSDIATQVSSLSAVVAKIAAAVAKISAKVKA